MQRTRSRRISVLSLAAVLVMGLTGQAVVAAAALTEEQLRAVLLLLNRSHPTTSADAGNDTVRLFSADEVLLDGSSSTSGYSDALSYEWAVVSAPAGVTVELRDGSAANAGFVPGAPGTYVFRLTVTGSDGDVSTDTVTVRLVDRGPTAAIEPILRQPVVGIPLVLDGTGSTGPDGVPLQFEWRLVAQPLTSGISPALGSGANATVTFDVPGVYALQLRVNSSIGSSTATVGPVEVTAYQTHPLTIDVIDAELDAVGDRVVTISERALTMIDAEGGERSVPLPTAALSVSVSPGGQFAAVGHDGWVSHVDLDAGVVLATHSVASRVQDVVLDGNGVAHCFGTGQWISPISVDMASGTSLTGSGIIRGGTKARLHPAGDRIYGADNGLSPSDVERLGIAEDGSLNAEYDSPYHGDFPFCGDLWPDPAGGVMLTRCRVVVRTTNDRASDLTYVAQLASEANQSIQHASVDQFANQWLVVFRESNWNARGVPFVQPFDIETGQPAEPLATPYLSDVGDERWTAQYVFGLPGTSRHYVLAVDDAQAPQRHALLTRQVPTFSSSNLPPVARVARYVSTRTSNRVLLSGAGSSDPEGAPLGYDWRIVSQPAGSAVDLGNTDSAEIEFVPVVAGSYELELRVNDGERESPVARASVNAFAPGAPLVHRLAGELRDIEYSKSLDAMVVVEGSVLRLIDMVTLSEQAIELTLPGHQVGLSPDGLLAAVSHAGAASLVDLANGVIVDVQSYADDWGDIVLDSHRVAHVVPHRDQWSYLFSLDFAGDTSSRRYGPRAGTQIRMHPLQDWIYGADRGLSPSDFEKWDVSTSPPTPLGDSPYHGHFAIGGNIWISEDGDRLVVAGGNTFHASSDASVDMTYAGAVDDGLRVQWADHSTERNEWVMVADSNGAAAGVQQRLLFYSDMFFDLEATMPLEDIPATGGAQSGVATHVFFADDGARVFTVLRADGLLDRFALQITDR